MAVSQAARHVCQPKRSHELALIRTGLCLKGTADKGIVFEPSMTKESQMNVFSDAAFACGWGTEPDTNPDSVKSRTGFVSEVANCPVLWISKLQPTIATSTMESEHTALSVSLRAAIPLLDLTREIAKGFSFGEERKLVFQASVHEDNQGALKLANLEEGRNTPRKKFYALRLHWFRSWFYCSEGDVNIEFIETFKQKADFLTKSLPPTLFQTNRKLSMGW